MLVRKELMQYIDFDEFIQRQLPVEDYPMQAIWSKHTRFGVIPDKMVVYRVYKESATFIGPDHPKYLWYHKGLMNIRRYLNELFPEEVVFNEEYCMDYELWKEFLLYVYRFDFYLAKSMITCWHMETRNFRQAKLMVRSRVVFYLFCLYKRITKYKEMNRIMNL